MLVERPSGKESISLLVRPASMRLNGQKIRPMAAVYLVDPTQPRVKMVDVLMQLFGLTKAEANLAAHIANGQTLHSISLARPC